MPRRLRNERREFSCTYLPLLEGEALTGLLIVIDDVTEKTLRDRDAAEQNELLALFQALMHDRSGFVAFIEETQGMLDKLRGQALDPAERQALLHTVKGTGAVMGASVIAALCHRAENEPAEGSSDEVRATIVRLSERWVDIMQSMSAVIELHGHGAVEVLTGELDRLSDEVRQGVSEQHILERLALWRLEPVERPLARLGRHAHALAKRLGKGPISVNVESFDVWTDPKQLGNFWSALIHVVRNAVDHGLEPHDVREASGKSPEGHLAFRARTDDRHLIIEIADDGRGIDWDSVRRVGVERGLAHDRPEDLSQALLVPGFSTRTAVTDTSGRGVGMSAVHDQVRRLGGVIALQSVPGLGTRWSFSFPHTVAHEAMLAPLRLSTARQPIPLPSG